MFIFVLRILIVGMLVGLAIFDIKIGGTLERIVGFVFAALAILNTITIIQIYKKIKKS